MGSGIVSINNSFHILVSYLIYLNMICTGIDTDSYSVSLLRKVLKDYTLSDGTFLPAGTHIACNSVSTHYDETFYPNAREFDGFRFVSKSGSSACPSSSGREEEKGKGEEEEEEEKNDGREMRSVKDRAVSTSSHFLTFGHGRHAWYVPFLQPSIPQALAKFFIVRKAPADSSLPTS